MVSEAKVKTQDVVLSGQPSVKSSEKPSTPATYTQDQVEKLVAERHSTLDKRISEMERQAKKTAAELQVANKKAAVLDAEAEEYRKRADQIELETARSNPDALGLYQSKRALREREAALARREAELEARKAEHEEAVKAVTDFRREQAAQRIAGTYGVEPNLLLKLGTSEEQMEELAKAMGGRPPAPKILTVRPDSGMTVGEAKTTIRSIIEKAKTR